MEQSVACGHINKQYYPKGSHKRKDIACELPKGHEGDHSAKYKDPIELNGIKFEWCYWNDSAGKEISNA